MLNSVTWAECSGGAITSNVTAAGVAPMHEMSLKQLLGRPLESGRKFIREGDHEDQGVPNTVEGGESEMEKWLRESGDEVQAWDDVSGKELDANHVWEARKSDI